MTLIIEDGSAVSNANSYATDAELTAYATARGLTVPATESERDVLMILATDYMNNLDYLGYRANPNGQYLSWPREGVYTYDRVIASDEIPKELKYAQMEAAIAANTQDLTVNENKSNVASEELDVLKVSYFSGGSWTKVRLGRVMSYLAPFLNSATDLQRT